MRAWAASWTALGVAVARRIETRRSAAARLCDDPLVDWFVPRSLGALCALTVFSRLAGPRAPRLQRWLAARTRYLDDAVTHAAEAGCRQVVLLAAGYDSRAWRLPALADGARIFEVDHPATQRRKLALLRRRRADAGRATFVAIDLLNQSVAERLLASGFDRDQPTVFVAEGVTMYLTPSAVGKLLALPAALAPAGSRLVFDYLEAGALAPGQELAEVRRMRRWRWLLGEEMSCGLAPDGLPALLQQHGLALVEAVSAAELAARFGCVLATGYGLVTARVAPVG